MPLALEPYLSQLARWPAHGKHLLAQHDGRGLVVYQAYKPEIGRWAAEHGHFGGPWSFTRQTWIKPNFLWMQYRSGWGTKPDREVTLAITLAWEGLREILRAAVHTSFKPTVYESETAWKQALRASPVRLQWDPDHHPAGNPVGRRAIQLGVAGPCQQKFAKEWILGLEDISPFVAEQRAHVAAKAWDRLVTPRETLVDLNDPALERKLQLRD